MRFNANAMRISVYFSPILIVDFGFHIYITKNKVNTIVLANFGNSQQIALCRVAAKHSFHSTFRKINVVMSITVSCHI